MSARTRTIGVDRVVSFEELPDPDSELCGMPGMETASLPAAIHAMETLPKPEGSNNLVCAVPTPAASVAGSTPGASTNPLAARSAPAEAAAAPLGAEALATAPQEVTAGAGTAY